MKGQQTLNTHYFVVVSRRNAATFEHTPCIVRLAFAGYFENNKRRLKAFYAIEGSIAKGKYDIQVFL
ncbi:MAG: hypothetical protein LPD71_15730 [Shewanella sp.]|nr:hypothetical protein [Shewanella sp.]MCF1458527.1 hypothetical protein [Shewanella sp.]